MSEHPDWMRPSPALKRMAEGTSTPNLRACDACHHRHPKGKPCNYPQGTYAERGCSCMK